MTLTAVVHVPQEANTTNCVVRLLVGVYDGETTENNVIGQSSTCRAVTDEDRRNGILHMTVHQVASQKNIVLKSISEKIYFEVKVRIERSHASYT